MKLSKKIVFVKKMNLSKQTIVFVQIDDCCACLPPFHPTFPCSRFTCSVSFMSQICLKLRDQQLVLSRVDLIDGGTFGIHYYFFNAMAYPSTRLVKIWIKLNCAIMQFFSEVTHFAVLKRSSAVLDCKACCSCNPVSCREGAWRQVHQ